MPRREERFGYIKEIVLEGASGERDARISDLSAGGCFIDTIANVPVGEPVRFQLTANDGRVMDFAGHVAYTMPATGFGVKFAGLTTEQKAFLASLLRSGT